MATVLGQLTCPVVGCTEAHYDRPELNVVFQEPTVGGLTGAQWRQLRLWEDEAQYDREGLCSFEHFPKDAKGPAEYCPEEAESWSSFCVDHTPETDWEDRGLDD